jgi:hypothetical protein
MRARDEVSAVSLVHCQQRTNTVSKEPTARGHLLRLKRFCLEQAAQHTQCQACLSSVFRDGWSAPTRQATPLSLRRLRPCSIAISWCMATGQKEWSLKQMTVGYWHLTSEPCKTVPKACCRALCERGTPPYRGKSTRPQRCQLCTKQQSQQSCMPMSRSPCLWLKRSACLCRYSAIRHKITGLLCPDRDVECGEATPSCASRHATRET